MMPSRHTLKAYDPTDWYWVIGGPTVDCVYSSKRGKYVPIDDAAYIAWCAAEPGLVGRTRTATLDAEADLKRVLANSGLNFGVPT
jgi:hypothetical protein